MCCWPHSACELLIDTNQHSSENCGRYIWCQLYTKLTGTASDWAYVCNGEFTIICQYLCVRINWIVSGCWQLQIATNTARKIYTAAYICNTLSRTVIRITVLDLQVMWLTWFCGWNIQTLGLQQADEHRWWMQLNNPISTKSNWFVFHQSEKTFAPHRPVDVSMKLRVPLPSPHFLVV